jgi:hypothetical protein
VRQRLALPTAQLLDELVVDAQQFSASKRFIDDVCVVGIEVAPQMLLGSG